MVAEILPAWKLEPIRGRERQGYSRQLVQPGYLGIVIDSRHKISQARFG